MSALFALVAADIAAIFAVFELIAPETSTNALAMTCSLSITSCSSARTDASTRSTEPDTVATVPLKCIAPDNLPSISVFV